MSQQALCAASLLQGKQGDKKKSLRWQALVMGGEDNKWRPDH